MKRFATLAVLCLMVVSILVGCSAVTMQEMEVIAKVTECEQGEFHPHAVYQATALKCLKEKKATLYAYYNQLAKEHGKYDYIVSFNVEGISYSVVRAEPYTVGESILVIEVTTYDGEENITIEYR